MGTGVLASVTHSRKGLKHLRKVGKEDREDEVGGPVRVFTAGGWPSPLDSLLLVCFPHSRCFTGSV